MRMHHVDFAYIVKYSWMKPYLDLFAIHMWMDMWPPSNLINDPLLVEGGSLSKPTSQKQFIENNVAENKTEIAPRNNKKWMLNMFSPKKLNEMDISLTYHINPFWVL